MANQYEIREAGVEAEFIDRLTERTGKLWDTRVFATNLVKVSFDGTPELICMSRIELPDRWAATLPPDRFAAFQERRAKKREIFRMVHESKQKEKGLRLVTRDHLPPAQE